MKIRYKLLVALPLVLFLLYLLTLYANRTFIPVKVKGWFTRKITEQINKEVDIGSLRFSLAKGFVLSGVKIYEGPREDKEFLFKAEQISFGIIYLPSLKRHRLIIPQLTLYKPYLNLERSREGKWNISALLAKEIKEKKSPSLRIAVNGLSFEEGSLSFADYYEERIFKRSITELRGGIGLSLPNSVSLNCTAKIEGTPIRIVSRFKLPKKHLSIELETENLKLSDYWDSYLAGFFRLSPTAAGNQSGGPAQSASWCDELKIDSGLAGCSLRIDVLNFEKVGVKGNIDIQNLKAGFGDIVASGNYKLEGVSRFNIKGLTDPRYKLRLELEKARISTPLKSLRNIENINGVFFLSEKRWVTKESICLLYNSPARITGEIGSPHKDFIVNLELSSTIPLENIADIADISIESGKAKVDTKIIYKKDGSYHISGTSQIKGLRLRQQGVCVSGDFSISGGSSGIAGDVESMKYEGDMSFTKAKIEGVGTLPFISDAAGEAAFSTRHINIKRLTGSAADTNITLSGDIDYTQKEPAIALVLKTDNLSLAKFFSTLPDNIKAGLKDIDAKGLCSLSLNFSGAGGKPESFKYEGNLSLKNGSLAVPYWPNKLSDIACEVSFNSQEIIWKDLYFNIDNIQYNSYGRLTDLTRPKISLGLKSKDIDLLTEIVIEDRIINIAKCKGRYFGSSFSATGKISDIKTAYADISGNAEFDLADAIRIFKTQQEALERLKPKGVVPLTFTMNGPLREMADSTLYVEGVAKNIYIWGFRLDDFYFDYRMKDRFIDIPTIAAHPYGGIINISGRANLRTKDKPYIINIDVKDVDLHQLITDTEFKNKKIKGSFAAKTVLNGYLDQKDSLKGSGWLQVSDGYLWEFPVMSGILELIFMMPPEYVTLTDAFGNFTVHNKRIRTEDFKMLSKTASLLWVGSLGFDGSLDFNITGRFAEDIIKKTTQPGKIAGAILREAGSLIMEIRLGGTLARPKYQIVPFPIKRILKENVVDKFKDIFGDIFE